MVVKQTQGIRIPKKYLYNAGVAVFAVVTATLVAREMIIPKSIPSCAMRYEKTGLFTWQRGDGRLLAPLDLQAKLNGRDWGVLDNVSFRKTEDLQYGSAMDVRLPREAGKSRDARSPSGTGFIWAPSWLKGSEQACLGYSIAMPDKFKFGTGGSLPGLFGGDSDAASNIEEDQSGGFYTRMNWRDNGKLEVRYKSVEQPTGINFTIDKDGLRIEPGRWLRIEQEVVLNTPGEANGILRIWIDGELRLERKKLVYRSKPGETLAGVVANVHYATRDLKWAPAPQNTALSLSPFLINWK
ncbi:MAG: hypothetical protein RLZ98_319 [Pseudomonadota bacterium]|jgi:hypothetical protein